MKVSDDILRETCYYLEEGGGVGVWGCGGCCSVVLSPMSHSEEEVTVAGGTSNQTQSLDSCLTFFS